MSRPNFFCDIDTLNHLIGMEFADDHKTVDISVDVLVKLFCNTLFG